MHYLTVILGYVTNMPSQFEPNNLQPTHVSDDE